MGYNTYLNGEYLDISQAKISVLDRGFLFGDSVYEVIPVFNGTTFGANEHLDRLEQSLHQIHMECPLGKIKWAGIIERLLAGSGLDDAIVYLQITRGAYSTRNHQVPNSIHPTVFATIMPSTPSSGQPLEVMTTEDRRWQGCNIKATTLLPNILARYAANSQCLNDAIFIKDGFALESTSSNLFMVKKGKIVTPPLTQNILPGITRQFLLRALDHAGLDYAERKIKAKELPKADEIWLTNSSQNIAPVGRLNGKPIGNGRAGAIWQAATRALADFKQSICPTPSNNNAEVLS